MNKKHNPTELNVIEDPLFIVERLDHDKLMRTVRTYDELIYASTALMICSVLCILLAIFLKDWGLGLVVLGIVGFGAYFVIDNAANLYILIAFIFGNPRYKDRNHFCPNCKTHLPSTLTWRCPCCKSKNGEDNEHSYFGACKKCGSCPDSLLCPECTVIIQLTVDPPETMATVVSRE
jgi:hypothetical protein